MAPSARGSFTEESVLNPRNPYAASKAGGRPAGVRVLATFKVPVVITRCLLTTTGRNQYPEKVIPLFVTTPLRDEPLPLYGDGRKLCAIGSTCSTTAGLWYFTCSSSVWTARCTTSAAATSAKTLQ